MFLIFLECVKITVAHEGQCNKKWFAANEKDWMQTKKIGCKQKRSDANKKPKPVTMQTKKIGGKQKTKTCHDENMKKDRMQTKRSDSNKKRNPVTMQTKKDLQTKKKME